VTIRDIDRRLLQLFICTMPFLSALGVAVWLPLPTLIAVIGALFALLTGRLFQFVYFEKDDVLLAIVLLLGILAIVVNSDYAGEKNLNYTVWFAGTFALLIVWCRAWLRSSRITLDQIGAAATIALIIASAAVCFEFVLANTTGRYLSDIIPYSTPSEDLARATVLLFLSRPRGLAAEPGFSAMVFEALGPLAWIYLRNNRTLLVAVTAVVLPGFLLCFSAGGLTSLFLAGLIVMVMRRGIGRFGVIALVVVAILVVVISVDSDAQWIYDQVIGRKIDDLAGTGESTVDAVSGRSIVYQSVSAILTRYPLGIGWGMVAQMYYTGSHIPGIPEPVTKGMVSLYFEVLVSAGVAGVLTFALYLLRKIIRLARRTDPEANAVLFALIAVSIHHAVVLEFWYPLLWFLICTADYLTASTAVEVPDDFPVALQSAE